MCERTLRYPGHAERMRLLRATGLLSDQPLTVDGVTVVPRRVTEALLFERWRRPAGEPELTVLHVEVGGRDATWFDGTLEDLRDRRTRAAEPPGGASGVDSYVAASDNGDSFAGKIGGLAKRDIPQELGAGEHPFDVLARNAELAALVRPGGEDHRREAVLLA
jgi:hypothetical protein